MSFPTVPQEQLEALRTLLAKPKRIVIVSHFNPDGDAIGSSLGLMHVLRAVGHTVKVVLPNTQATFLDGLPNGDLMFRQVAGRYTFHHPHMRDPVLSGLQ